MEIKALLMKARGLGHIVQKINVNRGRDIANFFRYRFVQDIVNQLLEVVNASHTILPMDLQCIATILRNIRMETRQIINSTNIDDRSQVARTIIEPIIMVLDHVLDERNDESFELVRKMIQKGILTIGERFQAITERIGILLSRTQRTTADYTVMNNMSYKNIAVLAQIPTEQDLMGLGSIEFSGFLNRTMRASMRIPKQAIRNHTGRTGRRRPVINIINRNVHLPTQEGERIASFVLSGKISTDFDVQTSLGDSQAAMSFSIENVTNILSSNPRCFFFRFTRDNVTSGRFSSDGITSSNFTNKTFVECSTTHLTSFAVLVDVSGEDTHSQNHEALSVVSYIGCAISIVCLLVAACLFIVLRKKVFIQEHHFLHLNLSIALLLGLTAFVSGIETASEYRASCLIVAILLHYFFMATFSWMLCEGILLFTMMKFVFYKGFFKSKVFFLLLGWGMPIPIVAVSAAVSHHQYGYEDKCWISEENGAIWAFIGPILLIIMMNSAVLIVTIYEIYKSNHNSLNTTQMNYKNTIKSLLRAAVIIVPLLGVTWVVGILAVNENTVVFAWIFTILNSLQGMFILILYVLRNEKFLLLCRQKLTQGFHSNVTSVKGVTIKGAEAISKILSVETKSIALDVTSNKETLSPVSNSYSQATDKSKETFV
ncbi:adhesion G protein-coupled receptor L3-like isoform X2 [Dysidea avara]